ncbi:MAG: protocatechuate 3,4-dioxygenase subunit alpha [Pseudomonadota bacterium]
MPLKDPYLRETPSQTAGPYVHIGLVPAQAGFDIFEKNFSNRVEGEGPRIRITGKVLDGLGAPITDVLLESWQADADGRFDNPAFRGWARAASAFDTGEWTIETVRPGAAPNSDGTMLAPQIGLWIVARGINIGLSTRLYFPEHAEANTADPVFSRVPPHRRETLLARPKGDGNGALGGVQDYRFDIVVQGEGETVFFDA